ncbi:CRTAC1 family protein, partial [bacterium]|nr:CRTAC1 family protein [bacterium]
MIPRRIPIEFLPAVLGALFAASGCGGGGDPGAPATTPSGPVPPFADVTAGSGLDFTHEPGARGRFWLPEGIGSGGALVDYDGDGDLDVFLVQGGFLEDASADPVNRLFRNDGALRFADVTDAAGGGAGGYGIGCAAADYDADGDTDLYVTRLGPNVLLRNDGGAFVDVTETAGVGDPGFGASAAWLDYDGDARLDLFVTNYVDWGPHLEGACYDATGVADYCGPLDYHAPSVDLLYRSLGHGRFRDATVEAGMAEDRGNGLGAICTDFDGDGRVDIFVANDQTPGFLWLNQGDGTFREDGAVRGCGYNADGIAIAGMGVAAEDLDDDGDFDLVVTNIHDQAHLAVRNDDGYFTDATHVWGFAGWGVPRTGFGLALFDQEHDGRLDGYVANGSVNRLAEPYRADNPFAEPDQFLHRLPDGSFVDASDECPAVGEPVEMSRGVLVGDLDGDGDLDLVVTANRGPARLLRNDQDGTGAWVMLELVANGGGSALNAIAEVEAGGRHFLREVRPHAGYLGTNDPRLHFGLGAATRMDRLTIRWPDGRRETWTDIPVRAHLRLRQGGA